MASSEFLSAKSEGQKDALKSSIYTVHCLFSDGSMLDNALSSVSSSVNICLHLYNADYSCGNIAAFNYYISVAKDLPFKKRFFGDGIYKPICCSVAALSFVVGIL
jgi:hypothetical protein